ncbi:bifunctional tetrahydrofolate synthase/dihydrofolate synthase [Ideonella dechloratans]|uniref:Dihydrofolate synthase/folylpolyglutamate synthase n=1 Tax=Ideonella dechloratans TaxID=36863 RepID=A0A643FAK0_IDEDE|nr:bifunctional tetrahydrofolate synthase/dihydrofolate synthase [Ideonella dechloratans]KAB0579501.1 bifunctional tetrahydrofolate synthase/dihydrofolate synthase [Ideonella dechloratans]UFU11609.1 bifunctional tetrahydrofolate synthase/dihydrofolate synthase [Ideonella dechloratans]
MSLPVSLDDWLAHCERLHPKTIDMTLDRVKAVQARMGLHFDCPVIAVAGTNGKGSTCAMIDSIARAAGWRVGLYSKPHLVHFEERCRINGEQIAAEALVPHFAAVEAARGDTTLTYFEFTTLAIARALATAGLDLVILEVGLGGRLDAVNAFDADCSVITSVDIDHVEYLGPDRESIGREKAGILRAGRPAIIADPVPPASVIAAGEALGADLWLVGRDFNQQGDRQQWSWSGRGRRYHALSYPALRGANQLLNASGAIAALESLRDRVPVNAQAVRVGLATVELPGRFQIVPGQPTLVLDVAHNAQSVGALALNLDQMGFYPRTIAVLGAMHDKDLASLVARLAPLVDVWHVTDLPLPRAATAAQLAEVVHAAAPKAPPAERHADPAAALAAALKGADPADRIVVFGSFYTVGGVLKEGLPRLGAPHQA